MSYLSNTNIPLADRCAAADAALAYVETIAHEESLYQLIARLGDHATILQMQSYNNAVARCQIAKRELQACAQRIANLPVA